MYILENIPFDVDMHLNHKPDIYFVIPLDKNYLEYELIEKKI